MGRSDQKRNAFQPFVQQLANADSHTLCRSRVTLVLRAAIMRPMQHIEIAAALIAFLSLTAAWFVVPAAARVHLELTSERPETVATAA